MCAKLTKFLPVAFFFLIREHTVEHFLNNFHFAWQKSEKTCLLVLWFVRSSKYDVQTVIQKIEKILNNSNRH